MYFDSSFTQCHLTKKVVTKLVESYFGNIYFHIFKLQHVLRKLFKWHFSLMTSSTWSKQVSILTESLSCEIHLLCAIYEWKAKITERIATYSLISSLNIWYKNNLNRIPIFDMTRINPKLNWSMCSNFQ